jgi:hypothetical protein
VSYQPHTVADLVSALSLGVSSVALIKLGLAFADADAAYFDPRPAVARAVKAVHQELVHAGHVLAWATQSARHDLTPAAVPVRHALYVSRELARDLAALVLLLTTSPKGATHV